MSELRAEEKIVAATITATLGLTVRQHDEGKQPGMHDLNIITADGTLAAVEVTAAADPDSIQLWKLVNGHDKRWTVPGLTGGWMLHLEPTAPAKRLVNELPAFLGELEREGVTEIGRQRRPNQVPGSIGDRARDLGIFSGNQSGTDFPGSIYLTIEQPQERTGGVVDSSGSVVPGWVGDFLRDQRQSDVLGKLARSGASERHAFSADDPAMAWATPLGRSPLARGDAQFHVGYSVCRQRGLAPGRAAYGGCSVVSNRRSR